MPIEEEQKIENNLTKIDLGTGSFLIEENDTHIRFVGEEE